MKNSILLPLLLLYGVFGFGQNTVSGFVNFEDPGEWEKKIFLERLHFDLENGKKETIATAPIEKDGFFAFDEDIFTSENQMYKVEARRIHSGETRIKSVSDSSVSFIISKEDSIYFLKGSGLFSNYVTSSPADQEWQKLKEHEATAWTDVASGPDQYLQKTRDYTKDSLQILLVKLLSIRKLEEQKLLQKDITENPDYYLDLLAKLQESELPSAFYAYLERRIRSTHQELLQRRYYTSLAFNGLFLVTIATLLYLLFRYSRKRKFTTKVTLSPQEENVKALILEGKSNKEIAEELFISINTVKTHITNIYSKLEVTSRKELKLRT